MYRKPIASGIVLLFILSSLIPMASSDTSNSKRIIYVDDDNTYGPWLGTQSHPYEYIQDGINEASNMDTVYVYSGIYSENIVINKAIILIGEDRNSTIIDGNGVGNGIAINSSLIRIENLSIKKFREGIISIFNNKINYIKILNCQMEKNSKNSIYLYNICNATIADNYIYNNSEHSIIIEGTCDNISIDNCTIINNGKILEDGWYKSGGIRIGGYDSNCYNINISNCFIKGNIGMGVYIYYSNNIEISNNTFNGLMTTLEGLLVNYCENVDIFHNEISHCFKNGIILSGSKDINIFENNIKENGKGDIFNSGLFIQLESKCITISRNNITDNINHGVFILDSSHIKIIENNFIGNAKNAYFEQLKFYTNQWKRNYWNKSNLIIYPIFGRTGIFGFLPCLNIDFKPVKQPYFIW